MVRLTFSAFCVTSRILFSLLLFFGCGFFACGFSVPLYSRVMFQIRKWKGARPDETATPANALEAARKGAAFYQASA